MLKAVEEADEALDEHLQRLSEIEMIREFRSAPELEYIFRHAIAQEVTYENLLLQRRRELHGRVGEALERLFGDRLEEFYSLLAYHYTRAETWEKAQDYLFKAGDQAGGIAADAEALDNYRQALQAYERAFGDRWDPLQHAGIEQKIGQTLVRMGDHAGAISHFEKALALLGRPLPATKWPVRWKLVSEIASQAGHWLLPALFLRGAGRPITDIDNMELSILEDMFWPLYFVDPIGSAGVLFSSLNQAERLGYPEGIAKGTTGIIGILDAVERRGMAEHYVAQALDTVKGLADPAIRAGVHLVVAQHYSQWADIDASLKHAELGLASGRRAGDIRSIGWCLNYFAYGSLMKGEFDKAATYAEDTLTLGEDVGQRHVQSLGLFELGQIWAFQGRFTDALTPLRKGVALSEQIPDYIIWAMGGSLLARCYWQDGQPDLALEVLAATEQATQPHNRHVVSLAALAVNRAAIYVQAAEEAGRSGEVAGLSQTEWLQKARPACRSARKYAEKARGLLPDSYRLQGAYEWLQDKPDAARHWWEQSLDFAVERGFRAEEALTRLEMGRWLRDRQALQQAAAMFEEMAMTHYVAMAQEALEDLA